MNSVYIYDGQFARGDAGFPLIRMAAARHCLENNIPVDQAHMEIIRDHKGKPYFADLPLEFSLTHSGNLWMCMFSGGPCGLDLQEIRDCNYRSIAARYFKPEESRYVEERGQEAFFRLWVRKEAYCKMTGDGLFGAEMPSVLEDQGMWKGKQYCFQEIDISDQMKCAVCTEQECTVELRVLA